MTDQEFEELKAEYRHGQDDPYAGPRADVIHALIELVEELQQVAREMQLLEAFFAAKDAMVKKAEEL